MRSFIGLLIASSVALPSAALQLQFQCDGLEGHSFFAEEGLVPEGEGGWFSDKGAGESVITLDFSNPEDPKISYQWKDATGTWKNPESSGAYITGMGIDPEDLSFMFLVSEPASSSVKLITIAEISEAGGRKIYSSMKNGSGFMNGALMTAECKFPQPSFQQGN